MNLKSVVPTVLLALGLAVVPVFAAESGKAKPAAPQAEADVIAKARANYPLKTCIVSDEALGSMGEATPYVHREPGKPDRVVFFCCDGCIDDFKKEPAKFLKKLDDAAAKSKSDAKKGDAAKKRSH